VALVPTYERIGIWGAVILTVLRFIQGVGVGGEWGGSVLLSMEWARSNKSRGFIASWPQFGVPCGLFLANLAVLAFSQMSGERFLAWGWRVPFLLSLFLVGVGLYIRLGILETPVFTKLLAERKIERAPILEVIKRQPKQILLSAFARMAEQAPFYIFTAFIFSYGTGTLHVSRDFLLTAVLAASVVSFFSIPFFGHLSDRIGRKTMYMIGAFVTGVFGFIYFGMVNTGVTWIIFFAIVVSLIPHDMMYGPQAALIAESFTGRLRYSGSSLGYQLASIIAGGPAPLIATWLFGTYHTPYAIAVYIGFCAVLSLIATALRPITPVGTFQASIKTDCCHKQSGFSFGQRKLPLEKRKLTANHGGKQMLKWYKESILDIYNLLLSLFLFATPWLFAFRNGDAKIDVWVSSAAVAVVSILALIAFSSWQEWLNLLLGVWLIISPWVIGFTHTRAMNYSIGIGAAVAFLAGIELMLIYDASTQDPVSGRGSALM